ncbi:MAG: hypothetical protein WBC06_06110 [Chitinophagaceae bacterium]
MKNNFKALLGIMALLLLFSGCKKKSYSLGDLTSPTSLVITTEIVGQTASLPNGDGSGDVKITLTANNALSYKVDYDASNGISLEFLPTGSITKKFASLGTNTYKITAVAYGKGGTSTTITKDITVRFDFQPDATIVNNLTSGTTKTWKVDKDVPGHFGVGPWNATSVTPEWWAAAPDEKVGCCNCFYTANFKFTRVSAASYTLQVTTPDGAFTKTGGLTTLPGIPGSGAEGCYSYGGGTSSFAFLPNSTRPANTSILLSGVNTFIGYGAVQKEFEILQITPTYLYLRVQGTETGNAWYLKMKPI